MRIALALMVLVLAVSPLAATQADDENAITPDIAVAHVKWGVRGDEDPDGTPRQPRNGVMMQAVMKRDGKWTVVAAQNTNIR